ncbi:NUDIX hydrolase [Leifsonia poae]|uniref:NUDIX hydrolase n=1 Tax=Leifsonia poae TaxID=110933 RepID=UPI001CBBB89A|nr:NUDIX domain-containing protein [Leifsonia poae]
MTARTTLTVSAVCFRDGEGRILTVRKAGTHAFMLPGGKLEPAETPAEAAIREISEEVGLTIDPAELVPLGTWRAAAANEADTDVLGHVFTAPLTGTPAVGNEIEELRWVTPGAFEPGLVLAPLLTEHVYAALL